MTCSGPGFRVGFLAIMLALAGPAIAQAPPRPAPNPPPTTAVEIEAFSQGAMLGIFFHAFGHMVISELKLASTEPEEDAVDELSTILLSTVMIRVPESEGESYAQVIMGSALYLKFSAEELRAQDKGIPFHDEHPPDERRVANILCLAAGADPHHFFLTAAKAGILQDRLRRCAETYQERQAVWDELLARAVEGRKSRGMLTLEVVPSRNPTYRRFEQVFEQGGDFDQMLVFFVAMGRLPRDVPIVVKDCGVANGFWSPREAEIVLCYEMLDHVAQTFTRAAKRAPN